MKKIAALLMALSLLLIPCAALAVSSSVTDMANDIITVSGKGEPGEIVTILILNPGFDYEDYTQGDRETKNKAVQYLGAVTADNDGYAVSLKITGETGGEFSVFAVSRSHEESTKFTFYNSAYKGNYIDELNKAENVGEIDAIFDNLLAAFGRTDDELNKAGNRGKICEALLSGMELFAGGEYPDDLIAIDRAISEALVVAALNANMEPELFEDNVFKYTDVIGVSDTDELSDYFDNLSSRGIENLKTALLKNTYSDISKVREKFLELVHYNVIMNYKDKGYGHIKGYLQKYKSEYEAAGMNLTGYGTADVYLSLLSSNAADLSAMVKKFNQEAYGNNVGNGGGLTTVSPGKTSSVNTGANYVPETTDETPGSVEIYTDVSENHWGRADILDMTEKGIIQGHENKFRPDDTITRAEFVKIIAEAFALTGNGAEFDDVSDADWFAPYIKRATGAGVIFGSGNMFLPNDNITRQDAAVILFRAANIEEVPESDFEDLNEIAEYALEAVKALSGTGVIKGYDDNTFRPAKFLTRAEAASIVNRLLQGGGK